MEVASDLEARTMHVFISRALQKIHREAPKKHAQLRQACNEVIGTATVHTAQPSMLRDALLAPCRRAEEEWSRVVPCP